MEQKEGRNDFGVYKGREKANMDCTAFRLNGGIAVLPESDGGIFRYVCIGLPAGIDEAGIRCEQPYSLEYPDSQGVGCSHCRRRTRHVRSGDADRTE